MIRITLTIVGTSAGFLLLSGCQDPRLEESRQRRNASIEKVVSSYEREEAKRNERVAKTLSQMEEMDSDRPEKLKAMTDKLEPDRIDRDEKWKRMQPVWNARLRKMIQGDPQGADDAFARMFY